MYLFTVIHLMISIYFLMMPRPLKSTLFPYTTLFRSFMPACRFRWACSSIALARGANAIDEQDRKSTRLNSSHVAKSYAAFCLKKKKDYFPIDAFNRKVTAMVTVGGIEKHFLYYKSQLNAIRSYLISLFPRRNVFVHSYSFNDIYLFFNDAATPEIYTLSLHDALPIFYAGMQIPVGMLIDRIGARRQCDR